MFHSSHAFRMLLLHMMFLLSGFFGTVMLFDDSDDDDRIVIKNPGRLAREINASQKSWVAVDYFKRPVTVRDIKNLIGSGEIGPGSRSYASSETTSSYRGQTPAVAEMLTIDRINDEKYHASLPRIPINYDPRKYYPHCKVLTSVRNQALCGSCWAVTSASALSDRFCIASSGKVNVQISAESLVSCCKTCGEGCGGGHLWETFEHFQKNGEITGGDHGSEEGCKPYSFTPNFKPEDAEADNKTPACEEKCTNPKYEIPYDKEIRYKTRNTYRFEDLNTTKIQWDLMLNGPLATGFMVYVDFYLYKSGVYRHTKSFNTGGHAAKVVGWGREKGVNYWLMANSWGDKWGLNGFFKIRRGYDECLVESAMVGGEVDLKSAGL